MKKTNFLFHLTIASSLLLPGLVRAQVVSFQFSGQLNTLSDPGLNLPPAITSSSPFSGTITYDTTGITDATGTEGFYQFVTASPSFSMTVSIAGNTFANVTTPPNGGDNHVLVSHLDNSPADSFQFAAQRPTLNGSALPGAPAFAQIDIFLENANGGILSDVGIPRTTPNLGSFPDSHILEFQASDNSNHAIYSLNGTVTSITPVPEPAAGALASGCALLVLGASWRRFTASA